VVFVSVSVGGDRRSDISIGDAVQLVRRGDADELEDERDSRITVSPRRK